MSPFIACVQPVAQETIGLITRLAYYTAPTANMRRSRKADLHLTRRKSALENIERTHFMVLTGHLDDQSLPDLIRTLRVQRKSGRLQVEYPDAPGAFFFEDGQMVAAELGTLRDVEALYAALAQRGAAYNFNPLVRPPERSIDKQGQKFIADLIAAPPRAAATEISVVDDERTIQTMRPPIPAQPAPLQLAPVPAELMAPVVQRLAAVEEAIVNTSQRFSRERLIYTLIISFLVGLILVTVLQVAYGPLLHTPATATSAPRPELPPNTANNAASYTEPQTANAAPVKPAQADAQPDQTQSAHAFILNDAGASGDAGGAPAGYMVSVRLRVKSGQVLAARVLNSRPGASGYEAVALKLALQRRYPDDFTGNDTLRIVVQQ